jgi:hypothetical protein
MFIVGWEYEKTTTVLVILKGDARDTDLLEGSDVYNLIILNKSTRLT